MRALLHKRKDIEASEYESSSFAFVCGTNQSQLSELQQASQFGGAGSGLPLDMDADSQKVDQEFLDAYAADRSFAGETRRSDERSGIQSLRVPDVEARRPSGQSVRKDFERQI